MYTLLITKLLFCKNTSTLKVLVYEKYEVIHVVVNASVHLEGIVERYSIVEFASGRVVEVVVVGTVTCVETSRHTFGVVQRCFEHFGRRGEGTLTTSIVRKGREGEVLRHLIVRSLSDNNCQRIQNDR